MNKIIRQSIMQLLRKSQFSKKGLLAVASLALVFAAVVTAQPVRPLKLVLAPRSTADPVEVMKHFSQSCPNITITTSQKSSDYMLFAGGWSGNYRFMVIAKGGDTVYATETALLSNSVKNVCKFLNARP